VKLICNIDAASPADAIGSICTKLATIGSWWNSSAESDQLRNGVERASELSESTAELGRKRTKRSSRGSQQIETGEHRSGTKSIDTKTTVMTPINSPRRGEYRVVFNHHRGRFVCGLAHLRKYRARRTQKNIFCF
jgi:hypothetical protein